MGIKVTYGGVFYLQKYIENEKHWLKILDKS